MAPILKVEKLTIKVHTMSYLCVCLDGGGSNYIEMKVLKSKLCFNFKI